jgi:3-oxoadipate enol-lactonase
MDRVIIDGITVEHEIEGRGEPVVLIHGGLIADSFGPMLAEPALAGRYQFITYHRRGYLGSSRTPGPVSIARHAADCRALLRHLGIRRVHVIGHSFGASVALQLALDAPDLVHSVAAMETALLAGSSAQSYRDAIARNAKTYAAGDVERTVDAALKDRFGAGYRAYLDRLLPGAFAQAVAHAGPAFELDLPAVADWRFTEAEASRIVQPALAVLGGDSDALWPRFGETHRLLLAWLPNVQGAVVPGATHALQMQNPRGVAEVLARFLARHPFPGGS